MFKTIDDLPDLEGKTALVRVDLNVPLQDGIVTDDTRIKATIATVSALRLKNARVLLLAHFDRPKGKKVPEMSLKPLVPVLKEAYGEPVGFAADCIGSAVGEALQGPEQIILMENVRFHAGEESNDADFISNLAASGDLYVNDAFSAAHRAHASTEGLAHRLEAVAGVTMAEELRALEKALTAPVRPVVALVGGAKVSSKLDVLTNLVAKVDHLIIGGGMANTFLAAQGINVGKSLCEHDLLDTARGVLAKAEETGCKVHLPSDGVVATDFAAGADNRVSDLSDIGDEEMILDVGPTSITSLSEILEKAKTLIWNGPMGAFEIEPFDKGTVALAQVAARLTRDAGLVSVAGGGDTVAALAHAGVKGDFSHVSTAGGAFLEWMEGRDLPGVSALMN